MADQEHVPSLLESLEMTFHVDVPLGQRDGYGEDTLIGDVCSGWRTGTVHGGCGSKICGVSLHILDKSYPCAHLVRLTCVSPLGFVETEEGVRQDTMSDRDIRIGLTFSGQHVIHFDDPTAVARAGGTQQILHADSISHLACERFDVFSFEAQLKRDNDRFSLVCCLVAKCYEGPPGIFVSPLVWR